MANIPDARRIQTIMMAFYFFLHLIQQNDKGNQLLEMSN